MKVLTREGTNKQTHCISHLPRFRHVILQPQNECRCLYSRSTFRGALLFPERYTRRLEVSPYWRVSQRGKAHAESGRASGPTGSPRAHSRVTDSSVSPLLYE
ncbi:hypothetical protein GN956_G11820 [Arapaima gigas]